MQQSSFESVSVSLFDLVDVGKALEESKSFTSKLFAFISIIVILFINIPLLKIILKQSSMFINVLFAADCFLCIVNSILLFNILVGPSKDPVLCLISAPYGYFIKLLNRLLSIGILVYRYVFVFRSSWVKTKQQRKIFSIILCGAICSTALIATSLCIFYRVQYFHYIGRIYRICEEYEKMGRGRGKERGSA